jgi:carboxyl-terminal processing protease
MGIGGKGVWYIIFTNIYSLVKQFYVQEVNPEKMIKNAIKGMNWRLNPYCKYIDSNVVKILKEEVGGIGLMGLMYFNEIVRVGEVIEGSPFYSRGLQVGDRILRVNSKDVRNLGFEGLVKELIENKEIKLEIQKYGSQEEFQCLVEHTNWKRRWENIPYAGIIDENIGYIRIAKFNSGVKEELDSCLNYLITKGMKKLILDLRSNQGGDIEEVRGVLDLFLPKGVMLLTIKGKGEYSVRNFFAEEEEKIANLPMIILLNYSSIFGSEIVASVLQEYERAAIIGDTSFGKGSIEKEYSFSLGKLRISVAKCYTPQGRCIMKKEEGDFFVKNETIDREFESKGKLKRKLKWNGRVIPDKVIKTPLSLSSLLIDPEVRIPKFLLESKGRGVFEKWGKEYVRKHKALRKNFKLEENSLTDFKEFMKKNEIKFKEEEFDSVKRVIENELEELIGGIKWKEEGEYVRKFENDLWIKEGVNLLKEVKTMEELFFKIDKKG